MNYTLDHKELFKACNILFGSEIDTNMDFLYYIQTNGIKSAYRKKAFQTHPDLQPGTTGNAATATDEAPFLELAASRFFAALGLLGLAGGLAAFLFDLGHLPHSLQLV